MLSVKRSRFEGSLEECPRGMPKKSRNQNAGEPEPELLEQELLETEPEPPTLHEIAQGADYSQVGEVVTLLQAADKEQLAKWLEHKDEDEADDFIADAIDAAGGCVDSFLGMLDELREEDEEDEEEFKGRGEKCTACNTPWDDEVGAIMNGCPCEACTCSGGCGMRRKYQGAYCC